VEAFPALVAALHAERALFVLIGIWAASLHARSAAAVFTTQDYDLFLPADVDNALLVWRTCESMGLELLEGVEVLVARLSHVVRSKAAAGRPKDLLFLATHEEALRDLLKRED